MALTYELGRLNAVSDDATLGNILIKHNDRWRGDYYLKDDLTFTVDKSLAARFYLLKSGDTTILNGDRISVNSGNRSLLVTDTNQLRLVDRNQTQRGTNTFLITNGTDNTDPITFETIVYLISSREMRMSLKYEWGMELITPTDGNTAVNYKPRAHPTLANDDYSSTDPITSFQFLLERADSPITNLDTSRNLMTANRPSLLAPADLFDGYKGAIMVLLLMVILVLCLVASR